MDEVEKYSKTIHHFV